MAYWLLKSEPSVYSLEDLRRAGVDMWEGVRNYQARNHLQAMKRGDLCFFYHSNAAPPGIAGICRVVREAYPDPTQFDPAQQYYDRRSPAEKPRWVAVDVEFVEKFPAAISLPRLRQTPALERMVLLSRSRLSVQPVRPREWEIICRLA